MSDNGMEPLDYELIGEPVPDIFYKSSDRGEASTLTNDDVHPRTLKDIPNPLSAMWGTLAKCDRLGNVLADQSAIVIKHDMNMLPTKRGSIPSGEGNDAETKLSSVKKRKAKVTEAHVTFEYHEDLDLTSATPKNTKVSSESKSPTKKSLKKYVSHATPTMTTKNKPRQRTASKDPAQPVPIPTCQEELGEADKTIMKMREDGKAWKEIAEKWAEMTGQKTSTSTLPNRITRIIAKLELFNPVKETLLVQAVANTDADFKQNKWRLVAHEMKKLDASADYKPAFLKKKYEEVEKKDAATSHQKGG